MNVQAMENSIAQVKTALQHLERRYAEQQAGKEPGAVDFQPFYDALSDDAVFHIPMTTVPRAGDESRHPWGVIGEPHRGKQAVIDAFTVDQAGLTTWEIGAPLEYFSSGDGSRVVVLLKERYGTPRGTVPWSHASMVFDVRDGKISRYTHLADMSGYLVITNYLTVAS